MKNPVNSNTLCLKYILKDENPKATRLIKAIATAFKKNDVTKPKSTAIQEAILPITDERISLPKQIFIPPRYAVIKRIRKSKRKLMIL